MIVIQEALDKCLAVLRQYDGIVKRRHTFAGSNTISDGFPESGGGASAAIDCDDSGDAGEATPEVAASDDDDGGDADSDPDGRPPHKNPSPPPGSASASKKHSGSTRSRTPRPTAGQNPEFKVIGIGEHDLAESIGMSVEFLRKDRAGKRLIPFYRLGSAIRYNPQRVTEALALLEVGGFAPKPKATKARHSILTAG